MSLTKRKAREAMNAVQIVWDDLIDRLERMKPGDCGEERWGALTNAVIMGMTTAIADRFDPKHAAAMQEAFKQAFDDIKRIDRAIAEGKK